MPALLTTEQLAEHLQVDKKTLFYWRKQGMPFKAIGTRTFRYDLKEVMEWAEKRNTK